MRRRRHAPGRRCDRCRQQRPDAVDRDRSVALDAQLAQISDHDTGVLASDIAQNQIALRGARHAGQIDDVADRRRALQQRERAASARGRDDDNGSLTDPLACAQT